MDTISIVTIDDVQRQVRIDCDVYDELERINGNGAFDRLLGELGIKNRCRYAQLPAQADGAGVQIVCEGFAVEASGPTARDGASWRHRLPVTGQGRDEVAAARVVLAVLANPLDFFRRYRKALGRALPQQVVTTALFLGPTAAPLRPAFNVKIDSPDCRIAVGG